MTLDASARLLYGSPLSRPKFAKFAAIALAVLVVISTRVIVTNILTPLTPEALRVFGLAMVWGGLLSIIPLAILWFLDRREPESIWLYILVFLWGALIATGIAQPVNAAIIQWVGQFLTLHPEIQELLGENAKMAIAAPLAGPIVEETTKGMGLLLVFWLLRSEFDSVRDGFIYGALVGLGFNFLEAPFYVAKVFSETGVAPWGGQLAMRHSLLGLGGHALYTGMFGLGLGLARQTARAWLRYAAPVGGWLLAFLAHFVNNGIGLMITLLIVLGGGKVTPTSKGIVLIDPPLWVGLLQGSLQNLILLFPFVAIAVVMIWQSGIWERQVIRDELADEREPVITPDEYEQVKGDRLFKTRHIPEYSRRTALAIVKAQNELAFRKWRVKQAGGVPDTDPLVESWRDELVRLRRSNSPVAA
ncbi:MAG: PrsW family intramembrane metalloprotease [Oscillatoriophycideae cyanobacterium NC_groundwater_1537_Pr4_S-0.65um_50_18]|nr:PrsW family intramembrane metalloprotease [Oscillatoriophycideae cyanobacterium NC_groundwater_1537_Pr4_S-0.65um_50_18]